MLNSRSRANSNGSLLVFSVGGHRKIRDHRGILTGYGLTQVGLESPSCIEDGCPCTKVSHQEIPVQESQSPNANRISGAESDQGWLSLQWSNLSPLLKKADWKLDTHRKMYGAQRKKDSAIEVSHRTGAKQRC